MAFASRIVNARFQLDRGQFSQGGDTVDLTGLRCSANITHAGGRMLSNLDLRVWGMSMSVMNQLTVLNKRAYGDISNNVVTVSAGDEESGASVVFEGTITEAWADGRDQSSMMFHVAATSGLYEALKPVPPTSYNGSVDVATVLAGIATQMKLNLENSGVSGQMRNPYWPGSLSAQLKTIADTAHIVCYIDGAKQVLAVWPRGGSRGGTVPLISKETGLVGYPAFTENGVQFRSLYNPNIVYGGQVEIESEFDAATGRKVIVDVSHNLDAGVPGGEWFTEAECSLLEVERAIR